MATRSVVSVMVAVTAHSNGIPSQGYFFLNKLIKVFETHNKNQLMFHNPKAQRKREGKKGMPC